MSSASAGDEQTMTPRSRLSYPGGFVPAVSVLAGFELDFHRCALCSHSIDARGWLHFASSRFVCHTCLADPWWDSGKAGERAAARVKRVNEVERETEDALRIY